MNKTVAKKIGNIALRIYDVNRNKLYFNADTGQWRWHEDSYRGCLRTIKKHYYSSRRTDRMGSTDHILKELEDKKRRERKRLARQKRRKKS